jgi:kynureninase
MAATREDCEALDAADPVAPLKARFALPKHVVYLDGNSLGALPRHVPERVAHTVKSEWGQDLIRSWNSAGWIDLPARVGGRIARLIGAKLDEVIAADSTSVNLFKVAAGALALRPGKGVILSESGNFPTDLYMLQGLAALGGAAELKVVAPEDIEGALDGNVAALVLTHVHYKSGRIHDMARLTAKAHAAGALAIWDLSHSAGALDLDLNRDGADLAIGCGYKYLNGGPGAPAFLFVAERHQAAFQQPLSGWMGHAAPFDFVDDYAPAAGIARGLCGTPNILSLVALDAALDVFDHVDMPALRAKSMALGNLFIDLVEARCPGVFGLLSPRRAEDRGNQVSLTHPDGYAIMQALIARGVIGDFRSPDVLRFGFAPLYIGYGNVFEAVDHLAAVIESGAWRDPAFAARAAVT